jgi:hypothetical protein
MKIVVYQNTGKAESKINADIPELRFRVSDSGLFLRKFVTRSVSPGGCYQEWVSTEIDKKGKIWYLLGYLKLIAEGLEETNEKQGK